MKLNITDDGKFEMTDMTYDEFKTFVNSLNFVTEGKYITEARLREVLSQCVETGYINEYSKHRILELIKK